jgi:ribosome-binding factor A
MREIMNRKKPSRRQLQSLCADIHPDDGTDPKQFFRPSRTTKAVDRKTLQLCRQVAETLNLVLSGECSDEFLQCLQVVDVRPAPDASQLLVLVSPSLVDPAPNPVTVLQHLAAANGRLRAEVAAAIVRRRAPKLVFQYVASNSAGEERP